MRPTLKFYFCIPYSLLTPKNVVFIRHHTVDPPYPFCLPHPGPCPSGNHYSDLNICVFGLVYFDKYIFQTCVFLTGSQPNAWVGINSIVGFQQQVFLNGQNRVE